MRYLLVVLCALPLYAQQQLTINASNAANSYPVAAPGSILQVQIVRGGPVPIDLDLTRYSVAIAGKPARLIGKAIGTIYTQVPTDAPLGPAHVILTQDGQPSIPAPINIAATSPGIFSAVQNGGPELNQLTHPAPPGGYLTLWGSGLNGATPTVEIAGVTLRPSYAGPTPGYPGLDQINVQIPGDTPPGCYVAVRVQTPDASSNFVPASIATGGAPCPHPFGLSLAEMRQLDAGQAVGFGSGTLISYATPAISQRGDIISVDLRGRDAAEFAGVALERPDGCEYAPRVLIGRLLFAGTADAGPSMTLSTAGKSYEIPRQSPLGSYSLMFPEPIFTSAAWTLSAPGGATYRPFQLSQTLPPPTRWTAPTAIDRSLDQTITWQADGYSADDRMTVTVGFEVSCRVPASAGSVMVPAALLRRLSRPGPTTTLDLHLATRPSRRRIFELPRADGAVEHAYFDYQFSDSRSIEIR